MIVALEYSLLYVFGAVMTMLALHYFSMRDGRGGDLELLDWAGIAAWPFFWTVIAALHVYWWWQDRKEQKK